MLTALSVNIVPNCTTLDFTQSAAGEKHYKLGLSNLFQLSIEARLDNANTAPIPSFFKATQCMYVCCAFNSCHTQLFRIIDIPSHISCFFFTETQQLSHHEQTFGDGGRDLKRN